MRVFQWLETHCAAYPLAFGGCLPGFFLLTGIEDRMVGGGEEISNTIKKKKRKEHVVSLAVLLNTVCLA